MRNSFSEVKIGLEIVFLLKKNKKKLANLDFVACAARMSLSYQSYIRGKRAYQQCPLFFSLPPFFRVTVFQATKGRRRRFEKKRGGRETHEKTRTDSVQ